MKRQSHGFGGVVWRLNSESKDMLSEIATVPELESVVGVLEPNVVRARIGAGLRILRVEMTVLSGGMECGVI